MGRISAFSALWNTLRGRRRSDAPPVTDQLLALPRMVSRTLSGQYTGLERSRVALMALALVYVVSPLDLVPEGLLLVFGLGDDALVLSWLAGTVLTETEAFLAWEAEGAQASSGAGRTVPGEAF